MLADSFNFNNDAFMRNIHTADGEVGLAPRSRRTNGTSFIKYL